MSKLFLVGAGPGDPDLITIKAVKALEKADVVLYDALANDQLLNHCKKDCELVYVGKKPGIHAYQQIYINDMIIDYGTKYENVVRLKGGDPFVFGRGHEELEHAKSFGMEVEVIPGISSSIAVPCVNQIPLTKRGVNESFWVVTGTTIDLDISSDIALAAQSSATVVILMGMKRLNQIISLFTEYRGSEEAVTVIQNGTKECQKEAFGTLESIENQVMAEGIGSPAIIVIGEVVRESKEELKEFCNASVLGI